MPSPKTPYANTPPSTNKGIMNQAQRKQLDYLDREAMPTPPPPPPPHHPPPEYQEGHHEPGAAQAARLPGSRGHAHPAAGARSEADSRGASRPSPNSRLRRYGARGGALSEQEALTVYPKFPEGLSRFLGDVWGQGSRHRSLSCPFHFALPSRVGAGATANDTACLPTRTARVDFYAAGAVCCLRCHYCFPVSVRHACLLARF